MSILAILIIVVLYLVVGFAFAFIFDRNNVIDDEVDYAVVVVLWPLAMLIYAVIYAVRTIEAWRDS
jgi:uncharacterized membrane protein